MKIEERNPQLRDIAEEFFGVSPENLPTDEDILKKAIVAEAVRLALDSSPPDESGWLTANIRSVRNWVTTKLQALIPELASPPPESDLFREVLTGDVGGSLTFLGDVLELSGGYYSLAPSRLVPVQENLWVLVSGLPTGYFSKMGFNVKVTGIGRTIVGSGGMLSGPIHMPVQSRESYMGLLGLIKFDRAFLESLIESEERCPWRPGSDWVCYPGNNGQYGFEDWGPLYHCVDTPRGFLSLWKASGQYWLRLRSRGKEETMTRVPARLFKHVCLILDEWGEKPRSVLVRKTEDGTVVEMAFSPPEAHWRWLHAVGARWLRGKDGRIRLRISADAVSSTIKVFEKLPVTIERSEL